MLYTIEVDLTEIPTLDVLHKYKIYRTNIITVGPGGGHPLVTLSFAHENDAYLWFKEFYEPDLTPGDTQRALDRHYVSTEKRVKTLTDQILAIVHAEQETRRAFPLTSSA